MRKAIFTLLFAGLILPVQAEVIDLDQAVSYAVKGSAFATNADMLRLERAAEASGEARLMNPEAGAEYDFDAKNTELTLSQPLRLSDISLSRHSYKKLLNEILTLEERIDFLNTVHEAQSAYYDLYIMQEEAAFSRERLKFLNGAKKYIHNSINLNNMSEGEVVIFEADILAAQTESRNLEYALKHEYVVFEQFLNIEQRDITLKKPSLVMLPSLESALEAAKGAPSPQKMLELRRDYAQKEFSVFKQDRVLPSFTPEVTYETKDSVWKAGVSVEFPLWSARKSRYKAHEAKTAHLENQLSVYNKIPLEEIIKKAYGHLSNQVDTVNSYQNKILPMYKKGTAKTEDNFMRGQASVMDVWQIRDKQIEAQTQYLKSLKTLLDAKIELELLIGTRLEDLQ